MKKVKIKKALIFIFALSAVFFLFSCGSNSGDSDEEGGAASTGANQEYCAASVCGNGVCEQCEDIILLTDPVQFTCAKDCPGVCGDGVCNPWFENKESCPQDCVN